MRVKREIFFNSFFLIFKNYIFRFHFSGDRSSGSEIGELDDESRSDLGISDNEDTNSIISQTMSSLLRKHSTKERSPIIDIGILRNNSSNDGEMSDSITELGMRNNNDATNRNLESMRNSLIDVEQRLKAQRYDCFINSVLNNWRQN